ncbi:MAG TPA: PepSY domain-containing protein, partial [Caulobacteraceae bacterium]|nr:PepSY domain-containing protein [Caulobacteraceae bacterium]
AFAAPASARHHHASASHHAASHHGRHKGKAARSRHGASHERGRHGRHERADRHGRHGHADRRGRHHGRHERGRHHGRASHRESAAARGVAPETHGQAAHAVISQNDAAQLALRENPGTVVNSAVTDRQGQTFYTFDIKNDQGTSRVTVNATTSQVMAVIPLDPH